MIALIFCKRNGSYTALRLKQSNAIGTVIGQVLRLFGLRSNSSVVADGCSCESGRLLNPFVLVMCLVGMRRLRRLLRHARSPDILELNSCEAR